MTNKLDSSELKLVLKEFIKFRDYNHRRIWFKKKFENEI